MSKYKLDELVSKEEKPKKVAASKSSKPSDVPVSSLTGISLGISQLPNGKWVVVEIGYNLNGDTKILHMSSEEDRKSDAVTQFKLAAVKKGII